MISQKGFCCPLCFLMGVLNHQVGFHLTDFLTIFKIKSWDFLQKKEACVVLVTEGLIFPLTNWACMNA